MISVIIPVHNDEKYVHVSINSVLKQSYRDFEIICIDDASTDSTLEILEYFSNKDSRVKILKNENAKGPGYTRNRGLNIAKGKYISFLDGDDWLSPNAFETLVGRADNSNLDVLMFKNIVYYEKYQNFGMERYYNMDFMNIWDSKIFNHWDLDKSKLFSIPNAPWNKFYLKSFLDENNIRFPNENLIHEDNPFFYKVFTSAERISIINKYFHNRRRRPNSITTLNNERLFDNIDIVYKILDVFLEDPKLYDYYKKEVLRYIFKDVLNIKHNQIDDKFKESFFEACVNVYQDFSDNYGLHEDILKYVDEQVLRKFKII